MQTSISDIIKEAESKKTAKQQAEVLKKHKSAALKAICGYTFDPAVRWLIPEGSPPPYKPLPKATDSEGALLRMYSQLEYLVDSEKGRRMNQIKREQIFVQLLESLDPDDAVLISKVRNKQLKIDVEAVKMAFPSISGEW
jgi:hypothetical protein